MPGDLPKEVLVRILGYIQVSPPTTLNSWGLVSKQFRELLFADGDYEKNRYEWAISRIRFHQEETSNVFLDVLGNQGFIDCINTLTLYLRVSFQFERQPNVLQARTDADQKGIIFPHSGIFYRGDSVAYLAELLQAAALRLLRAASFISVTSRVETDPYPQVTKDHIYTAECFAFGRYPRGLPVDGMGDAEFLHAAILHAGTAFLSKFDNIIRKLAFRAGICKMDGSAFFASRDCLMSFIETVVKKTSHIALRPRPDFDTHKVELNPRSVDSVLNQYRDLFRNSGATVQEVGQTISFEIPIPPYLQQHFGDRVAVQRLDRVAPELPVLHSCDTPIPRLELEDRDEMRDFDPYPRLLDTPDGPVWTHTVIPKFIKQAVKNSFGPNLNIIGYEWVPREGLTVDEEIAEAEMMYTFSEETTEYSEEEYVPEGEDSDEDSDDEYLYEFEEET